MIEKAKKPVIAVVFHSANLHSGATRSLMDIIDNLILLGKYEFIGIFPSAKGSAVEHLKEKDVPCYSFYYGTLTQDLTQSVWKRAVKIPFLLGRHARIMSEARKAAKELHPMGVDMVYSNTSSIVFGGYLGSNLQCKQVWHIREFREKDHRIKIYLGENWLKRFIDDRASRVMFVSQAVRDENTDVIAKEKCVVTYNSYSDDFIDKRAGFNYSETLNIMLAGDIKESKGQLVLVQAARQLQDRAPEKKLELFLAGRESNKENYQQLITYIRENGMQEQVHLLGQVSDMKSLRRKMDVGIVASTCEAFGRTTIEGMLSCLAMIGRASGGTIEQIENEKTGLLYDGSIAELAEKLEYLYDNRDKMEAIALNGFEYAVNTYAGGRCYRLVENTLDQVLKTQDIAAKKQR